MDGTIQDLTIKGCICSLYLPPEYYTSEIHYPVVYMNGGDEIKIPEIMRGVEAHIGIDCEPFLLLGLPSKNWNEDYSPWPAPALTKKSEPFGGGAAKYLTFLTDIVKPFIDKNYRTKPEPENTSLIGYSLGGLAAFYSMYLSGAFGRIGSMSGSLWFDGWTEFMNSNKPINTSSRVYLSLGKGEEHNRNPRMSKVGDCTLKAAEILQVQLEIPENLKLEWNDGGHFTETPMRHQRALLWLMCKSE